MHSYVFEMREELGDLCVKDNGCRGLLLRLMCKICFERSVELYICNCIYESVSFLLLEKLHFFFAVGV